MSKVLVLSLALVLALASCVFEVNTGPAGSSTADTTTDETTTEPEAPAWTPEPWHIYVLDENDSIVVDELEKTPDEYAQRFYAWTLQCDVHNVTEDPEHPWHVVGGGMK
jgi:hypothetical protein